jgi:FKBP-type peptidyl-prolyl cis-trans isomerase
MKKLTFNEYIGVTLALAVVAFLLFGSSFVAFFNGTPNTPTTTAMNDLSTGIQTQDIVVGAGEVAAPGDTLTVNYKGTLTDGKVFDSSYDRNTPFSFVLGQGKVIRGWEEGFKGMRVGGKRRITVAPDYGYGTKDFGPIPANSTLIFDVELLNVAHTAVNQ